MSRRQSPGAQGRVSERGGRSPAGRGPARKHEAPSFREQVLSLVARIPPGFVATYGQISMLAGHARRARHVGNVLASLPPGNDLPWHRVINAQGRVSPRGGGSVGRQERLLRQEGLRFKGGRVNLARYRWEPVIDAAWARLLTDV